MAVGWEEVLLILIIILILFGPKRLPALAKAIGNSVKEYRKAVSSPETETKKRRKKSKELKG
jgi:sec-independent protein translocase protein TatA